MTMRLGSIESGKDGIGEFAKVHYVSYAKFKHKQSSTHDLARVSSTLQQAVARAIG